MRHLVFVVIVKNAMETTEVAKTDQSLRGLQSKMRTMINPQTLSK